MNSNKHEIVERAEDHYRALLKKHGVTGKRQDDMAQAFKDGVLTGLDKAKDLAEW